MTERFLSDEQWQAVASLLPGKEGDPGRKAMDNRLFLEANILVARQGLPWRKLPPEYGKWYTVYTRCLRWQRKGVWPAVIDALLAAGVRDLSFEPGSGLRFAPEKEQHEQREQSEAA